MNDLGNNKIIQYKNYYKYIKAWYEYKKLGLINEVVPMKKQIMINELHNMTRINITDHKQQDASYLLIINNNGNYEVFNYNNYTNYINDWHKYNKMGLIEEYYPLKENYNDINLSIKANQSN